MLAETPRPKIQSLPKIEVSEFSHTPPALALSQEAHARSQEAMLRAFPRFVPRRVPLPACVLETLQGIASNVTQGRYRGSLDLLKQVIFDANTLALNPPCATGDVQKIIPFSVHTYQRILETVFKNTSIEQSDLEYLYLNGYLELDPPQRFFLLSLYTLKKPLRTLFLHSDHGSRLLDHSGLAHWLTHSPYIHFQQKSLNTCIATVFAQECLSHAPTLAALYPLCRALLKRLRILRDSAEPSHLNAPAWKQGPTIASQLDKRLSLVEEYLQSWNATLTVALRTPASRINFEELASDGHACLERLLTCASIAAPNWGDDPEACFTLNSPYAFPGKWHLSCGLLCIQQAWKRLFKKNTPTLKERYYRGYVSYDGCRTLLRDFIHIPASKAESYLVFPAGKCPSDDELMNLWEHVTHMGSARLERPGHAALLRSCFFKDTPQFILDDPTEKHSQRVSFNELANLFTDKEIILFLEVTQESSAE